jgi:hypothetical protein
VGGQKLFVKQRRTRKPGGMEEWNVFLKDCRLWRTKRFDGPAEDNM